MGVLDIILGGLLAYAVFKGIRNGLFVELASFVSLLVGIFIAVKFSSIIKGMMTGFFNWNPKTIQAVAFIITFIIVIVVISLLAKILTKMANFAHLGLINSAGGGFFRVLKTILIISIFLNIFEKINFNNMLAKKQTLDNSLFYNPIQKTAKLMYPSLEKWYEGLKKT